MYINPSQFLPEPIEFICIEQRKAVTILCPTSVAAGSMLRIAQSHLELAHGNSWLVLYMLL